MYSVWFLARGEKPAEMAWPVRWERFVRNGRENPVVGAASHV
ncbi:hypothetical protein [Oxalobacter aliiformigenes]|nr:hypothetical protein [Oxalobacter aliiformigenes]